MLIPRNMPVDLAWMNILHGVPHSGPFAPCPASPETTAAWAMTIPWAISLLGSVMGKVSVVLPPTLPGVAWMVRDRLSVVDLVCDEEPLWLTTLSAILSGGVQWAGALHHLDVVKGYAVGLRLDPFGPPPSTGELSRLSVLFRSGSLLVLAFRVDLEHPVELPHEWRAVRGDLGLFPGLPTFDVDAFGAARVHAWTQGGEPIGLLGCERVA